jgi:subtilisin family serine protease
MSGTVEGAAELLQAYAPYLRYHEDERFRATRVEALVEASLISGSRTELRQADGTPIASTDPATGFPPLTMETLCQAKKKYPGTGVRAHRTDLLAGELPDGAAFAATPVAYTRVVASDDDGGVWLQYWLFSYHNPHHLVGDHQGDWELIQLKVDPGRTPQDDGLLAATCWQHGDQDGRDASDLSPLLGDDRLLTFTIARGSHASYFDLEYVHFGDELQIEAPAERPELIPFDEGAGWVNWPGYWGKSRVMHHPRSPRGPRICRHEWESPQVQHEAGVYRRALRFDKRKSVPTVMTSTSVAPATGSVSMVAQVDAEQPAEALVAAVEGLGMKGATVTPLDEGGAPGARRQLLVEAVAPAETNPFDLARAVEAEGVGWEVEPDLDSTIFRPSLDAYKICDDIGEKTKNPRWAIDQIGCPAAWEHSTGEGVRVGHPDTGYLDHPELSGTIGPGGYDVFQDDPDPHDVLAGVEPLHFPGHGTGTASVIGSRKAGALIGAAPGADVIPFRVARSVVLLRGKGLLRGIHKARKADCRVISISLGGLFLGSALREALAETAAEGRIVVAAAGQPVRFVVEPASYASTIGVAGSTFERKPWEWTARGKSVDICAPAAGVQRAAAKQGEIAGGHGTSFSAALTAGVAALWFGAHSEELLAGDPAKIVPTFRSLLKQSARPLPQGDWDLAEYGAGIIDAAALLALPLSAATLEAPPPEVPRGERIVEWLARLVEEPAEKVKSWLDRTFEKEAPEDAAVRVGTELASLSSEDEAVRRALGRAAAEGRRGLPDPLRDRASESLKTTAQPA